MRYFFLLPLCLLFFISGLLKAFEPIPPNDFIAIADPILGNYEIEKQAVPVKKYTQFLNAVATTTDSHRLYSPEMKSLIVYHPAGWFTAAYYSAAPGKADLPMSYVTCDDAMRYCNWTECLEPTAEEAAELGEKVTESGSYIFEKNLNGEEMVTANADAFYRLPSKDQLAFYVDQTKSSSCFEWTSSKMISAAPDNEGSEESWLNVALLFDQPDAEPQIMNEEETNKNVGFRLVMNEQVIFNASSSATSSEALSSSTPSSQQNKANVHKKNGLLDMLMWVAALFFFRVLLMLGMVGLMLGMVLLTLGCVAFLLACVMAGVIAAQLFGWTCIMALGLAETGFNMWASLVSLLLV